MKAYSFPSLVHLVNGVPLSRFAEGDDVVMIERLTDAASHKVGADGKMTVSLSADKSGKVTFKLDQASASNTYLAGLSALQGGGPATFIPILFMVQDTNLQDIGLGSAGYVQRPSDMKRGATSSEQEWVIIVEDLALVYGAAAVADI